jgi:hypothetical protein
VASHGAPLALVNLMQPVNALVNGAWHPGRIATRRCAGPYVVVLNQNASKVQLEKSLIAAA